MMPPVFIFTSEASGFHPAGVRITECFATILSKSVAERSENMLIC